jgi:hypothetical protein
MQKRHESRMRSGEALSFARPLPEELQGFLERIGARGSCGVVASTPTSRCRPRRLNSSNPAPQREARLKQIEQRKTPTLSPISE